jgi:Icc-related predicted phosphoesterase
MNLLLFSDLHTDTVAAERLVELSAGVDVVVGAGDYANVRTGISRCIDVLKRISIPTVLVPGNNESYDELVEACRGWTSVHVLHGTGVEIAGVQFFGIGGGIPLTPFGSWSYDFSETDGSRLLAGCPDGAVLVSHSPPNGAVDVSRSGQSLGSTAVREAVLRLQPRLVVCGHIHESAGRQGTLGDTPVINAGPKGILFDLKPRAVSQRSA